MGGLRTKFRASLQVTGDFLYVATSILKTVLVRIFKVFEVASYNFKFYFRHNKAAKTFKNYQRMDRKYLFDVLFRTFKENIHLMTQSF
jgi:hypothetical protein